MSDEPEIVDGPEEAPVPEEGVENATAESGSGAKIVVKRGGAETDIAFEVYEVTTIGRFDPAVGPIDVDLKDLPEGQYVSRKHAKIWLEDGAWKIQDLGSSNGTFILRDDFERVEHGELEDGAEFALGNARFIFKIGEQEVGS